MNDFEPELTIAVLARNRPEYLRLMLASVLTASRRSAFVVVRDHSDDDRCKAVVDELSAKHEFGSVLSYRYTEPPGQSANVLGAIGDCATEFLCILNDDDVVEPVLVSALLPPLLNDEKAVFSTGNFLCIDRKGVVSRKMRPKPFLREYVSLDNPFDRARFHVIERSMRPFMGTIFRVSALRGLRLPVAAPTLPDLWIARHLADTGVKGWCTDELVFRYRVHQESVSGAVNDLEGYRWTIQTFLSDPMLMPFAAELNASLRAYERSTFVGAFVRGDRSRESVERILDATGSRGFRRVIEHAALRPPFAGVTCRYLQSNNPRLRSETVDHDRTSRIGGTFRKVLVRR